MTGGVCVLRLIRREMPGLNRGSAGGQPVPDRALIARATGDPDRTGEVDGSAEVDSRPVAAPREQPAVTGPGDDRRQANGKPGRARRDAAVLEDQLAWALGEVGRLRAEMTAARTAAAAADARAAWADREITALRTQAQMALAANLRWPPSWPGAADRADGRSRVHHRPALPAFQDPRGPAGLLARAAGGRAVMACPIPCQSGSPRSGPDPAMTWPLAIGQDIWFTNASLEISLTPFRWCRIAHYGGM